MNPTTVNTPDTQAHVEQAWHCLHQGAFEGLLRLTHGLYAAGPDSLEAAFRVLLGEWRFAQFPFQGASGEAVWRSAQGLSEALEQASLWQPGGLEQALTDGSLPRQIAGLDCDLLLRALILRTPTRLPLLPVMLALGRDECQRRLLAGAHLYRTLNLIG